MRSQFTNWQILGFLAAICFLIIYINIAEDVFTHDSIVNFDQSVSSAVQQLRTPRLTSVMLLFTCLANWQIIGVGLLLSILFLSRRRQWFLVMALLLSVFGGEVLVFLSKISFSRGRPDTLNALIPAKGLSFPSGHAFVAITFYGFIAWILMTERQDWPTRAAVLLVASVLAAAIGFSRIYLGVHWPSDIFASYFLALAWLTFLTTMFRAYVPTRYASNSAAKSFDPSVLAAVWIVAIAIFYYLHPLPNRVHQ